MGLHFNLSTSTKALLPNKVTFTVAKYTGTEGGALFNTVQGHITYQRTVLPPLKVVHQLVP